MRAVAARFAVGIGGSNSPDVLCRGFAITQCHSLRPQFASYAIARCRSISLSGWRGSATRHPAVNQLGCYHCLRAVRGQGSQLEVVRPFADRHQEACPDLSTLENIYPNESHTRYRQHRTTRYRGGATRRPGTGLAAWAQCNLIATPHQTRAEGCPQCLQRGLSMVEIIRSEGCRQLRQQGQGRSVRSGVAGYHHSRERADDVVNQIGNGPSSVDP
jgi:hypothetical protein